MNQMTRPIPAQSKDELPSSLAYIAEKLETNRHLKPSEMRKLILDANVKVDELMHWADFDHPVQDSYGRNLVYKGNNFEIMVMSWCPGDFSTIHDHGHTQWGAVQTFGPAEHATFRVEDGAIHTLARWQMNPGEAIGVHHNLVHQMGNATKDKSFVSLHVYGEPEDVDNVTGDARVFDLENGTIQRVDGGVFFALPSSGIKKLEKGPKGDYPTRLRHMVELIRRLMKMEQHQISSERQLNEIIADFMAPDNIKDLLAALESVTDTNGHQNNSVFWRILNWELKEAAQLQDAILSDENAGDQFHQYASLYDEVICKPCLNGFMGKYLHFFKAHTHIDFSNKSVLSIGCGTGLVEEYMIKQLSIPKENLYGIDISAAMIEEAQQRIHAEVGDVLTLDPAVRLWDVAYSGLNVFHYINNKQLEEAITKTANIIKPGGYFLGDFITPDHIRWYPNVIISEDQQTISLRTPELVEEEGSVFQQSEIINIQASDKLRISYAGKHRRFLPPVNRIRYYFEKAFDGQVDLFDAVSLQPISEWADSCPSTRYIVIAQKK